MVEMSKLDNFNIYGRMMPSCVNHNKERIKKYHKEKQMHILLSMTVLAVLQSNLDGTVH